MCVLPRLLQQKMPVCEFTFCWCLSQSFEEAYESFKDACRLVASVVEPSTSISYCNVLDRMAEAVAVEGRHPQRRNQPLQVVSLNLMVKTLDILGALYAPYDLEIGTGVVHSLLLLWCTSPSQHIHPCTLPCKSFLHVGLYYHLLWNPSPHTTLCSPGTSGASLPRIPL